MEQIYKKNSGSHFCSPPFFRTHSFVYANVIVISLLIDPASAVKPVYLILEPLTVNMF
jgi:hypothetical protein